VRFPFRATLFGSFLVVIAVLAVAQALVLRRGLREEFLSLQRRELRREMELIPPFMADYAGVDPDSAARALSRRIGYPVTILDDELRVIAASSTLPFQLRGMVVSPESPELQAALEGEMGFAERRGSGEVEIRLFAARRVTLDGSERLLQVAVPLDEIRRSVRQRTWSSLGLALPVLLLAAFLTAVLGRAFLRPLHAVSRRARGLAAGNFKRRIPRGMGVKELDELAGTFNRLVEELEGRFRSLELERDEMQALIDCMGEAVIALTDDARVLRTNRAAIELLDFPEGVEFAPIGTLVRQPALRSLLENSVVRPFTAREVTLADRHLIVSARSVDGGGSVVTFLDVTEIRRLEMVRRDFVANASHELKTPLTAMRGFAETLLEGDPPPDLRRNFLSSIRSNTLRLQRLVDDLLDLSRLESGGWVAKEEVVDLAPLVREVWTEMAARAEEQGIIFLLEGDAPVVADEQGLEQIFKNLLDNAIRYTPGEGTITVAVKSEEVRVKVAVRDTGSGIPSASVSRIFERFFRVDPARSRAEGGTGLGLAIVRHLVHAMGGDVWAESELGQGTTVHFTLPPARAEELEP
jgi:two-component system phosphate regulon sensor histidine kinase PhoR